MGSAISWIAFKDKTATQVQERLALRPTGRFEEIPEGMFSAASFGSWYLVFIDRHAHEFVREAMLEKLSADCEVVAVTVEEHVMFSSAEHWSSGKRLWSVVHESESGSNHLEESGSLPPSYAGIKDRLLAEQKKEDEDDKMKVDHVFDVPLEFAELVTGFKHDNVIEAKFEILEKKPSTGLLTRFFGKK